MLGVGSIPSHYHWAQAARKWMKNHGMERRHLESLNWNAEAYKDRQQQDTISLSGNDFWRPSRQWQGFTLLVAPAKWIRLILAGSLYPKSFPLKSTILEGCWGLRKFPRLLLQASEMQGFIAPHWVSDHHPFCYLGSRGWELKGGEKSRNLSSPGATGLKLIPELYQVRFHCN